MRKQYNIIGNRYGRLVVIGEGGYQGRKRIWKCQCDCGKVTFARTDELKSGNTQSCGCLAHELLLNRITKHGQAKRHKPARLFKVWVSMKQRCFNPNSQVYAYYGGRGISVCSEWVQSFEAFENWSFLHGYKEGLEIDRINNNGNYDPNNCRWVTHKQNCQNRRNPQPNVRKDVA